LRRVFNKLENINIKYKLFLITTGLLVALAIIIYMILYFLLPTYYHQYKIDLLDKSVSTLCENSPRHNTNHLQERLYYMSKNQNLSIIMVKYYMGKMKLCYQDIVSIY
jgi:two-component system sensor histidine kinase VanS